METETAAPAALETAAAGYQAAERHLGGMFSTAAQNLAPAAVNVDLPRRDFPALTAATGMGRHY